MQMLPERLLRAIDDPDMFGCSGETEPTPAHFWKSLRTCPTNMTCVVSVRQTSLLASFFDAAFSYVETGY